MRDDQFRASVRLSRKDDLISDFSDDFSHLVIFNCIAVVIWGIRPGINVLQGRCHRLLTRTVKIHSRTVGMDIYIFHDRNHAAQDVERVRGIGVRHAQCAGAAFKRSDDSLVPVVLYSDRNCGGILIHYFPLETGVKR